MRCAWACLFSKPITLELDVRMTYGSFTWSRVRTRPSCLFLKPMHKFRMNSTNDIRGLRIHIPASSASDEAPLGCATRVQFRVGTSQCFFSRTRVRFRCERRECLLRNLKEPRLLEFWVVCENICRILELTVVVSISFLSAPKRGGKCLWGWPEDENVL